MSKNLIDAIDNFSESLKGENVDSMNLVQAIDNLSDIMDENASSGGNSSNWPLADRIAKGTDNNNNVVQGAIIEGSITGDYKNIASGNCSHAEGSGTKALGPSSHAQGGSATTASGPLSHAEGNGTTSSNVACHTEGSSTTASGSNSHAEGFNTIASGDNSHAEGASATASGLSSHAEGGGCVASGDYSHAEGGGTIANHAYQHVFGQCNIADPSTAASNQRGNYIEIVGNSGSSSNRSNARTLDWNGNEKLAGSLTLGMGTQNEVTITAAQIKQLLALLT